MNIQLHQNARTTPAIRLELQSQPPTVSNRELAEAYNLNRHTIAKWRQRAGTEDASHRPRRLHATLSAAQEGVVVALRETLLLPLDDLLAVTHEFIHPEVSRAGLDRCLRRHGVANLKARIPKEEGPKTPVKTFKEYAPGVVHVDVKYLPQMPDEDQRTYLFAAIDRATRWVYVEILKDKSATSASGFLNRLIDQAPFTITKVLTDNGKEFTDRFCATGQRQPTGNHAFDRVCTDNQIEHRLIKPRTPQTNGMIERFNGRIADVLATTRFDSAEHLADTIKRYVRVYNQHIPQKALGHIPPLQAMKNWYKKQPNLFKKRVYNLAGLDSYPTDVKEYFGQAGSVSGSSTADTVVKTGFEDGLAGEDLYGKSLAADDDVHAGEAPQHCQPAGEGDPGAAPAQIRMVEDAERKQTTGVSSLS